MFTKQQIDSVARKISSGPLGLAYHEPHPSARFGHCFENVAERVTQDGGKVLYGWTFHLKHAEKLPGLPPYIYATHHAVWHAPPDGRLVDVTPYPDEKHRPVQQSAGTLFLLDPSAQPVQTGNQVAPLPLRFFALDGDEALSAYIDQLNSDEQKRCEAIYARGRALARTPEGLP